MASVVDAPIEKKKSTVRRLLTPVLFSEDNARKKESKRARIPCPRPESKTTLETAFVGTCPIQSNVKTKGNRKQKSRTLSPVMSGSRSELQKRFESISPTDSNRNYENVSESALSVSSASTYSIQSGYSGNGEKDTIYEDRKSNCGRVSAPPAPYSQYYTKFSRNTDYNANSYENVRSSSSAGFLRSPNEPLSPTYGRIIYRPEPVYSNRPRSVSPSAKRVDAFIRGSVGRNTINSYHPQRQINDYGYAKRSGVIKSVPIFQRGALVENRIDSTPSVSKKVSFSYNQRNSEEPVYWPTRRGLAVQPPTKHSVQNLYENIPSGTPMMVNKLTNQRIPLSAIPKRSILPKRYPSILENKVSPESKSKSNGWHQHSESESGSEAGEVQKILHNVHSKIEEEWNGSDAKGRGHGNSEQLANRTDDDIRRSRGNRREDPRRHTLSGDHHLGANYHLNNANRGMDLESSLTRGYPPPSNSILFDDDPGIMSEVETSSTGFRRGNKQRSSLPVVRTPSKTLERPLGLVFLQYRNETKRSLLPNEITSLDTVKALFVRSFPKQLTMEYLDSPQVKIYIHDSNKDMFYELEDLRSHLNEIRDRSVLRLFESADVAGGNLPSGFSAPSQMWGDQDQSYFSEPEFDSEFQHQHIHKTKGNKANLAHQPYYMTHSFPPGSSATLPRGGSLLRPFSPAVATPKQHAAGFMSSPERAAAPTRGYGPYSRNLYEDPYYAQYGSRPSSITPIIDEEASDTEILEDGYSLYGGVKLPAASSARSSTYGLAGSTSVPSFDATRLRVEHMERQLANLTGLVQKALTQTVPTPSPRERDLNIPANDETFIRSETKAPKLSKDKSVSFEKSVSFSDDPPDMNSPKQHSPQHTDSKPAKPAIKSSTLPRTSSQERERFKPVPPPKPLTLSPAQYDGRTLYRDLQLTPEMYNQLRGLQKKAKDLRHELRNLRRMSQAQAHSVKETVRDTFVRIRSMVLSGGESLWTGGADSERIKVSREEDIYRQEIMRLEDDMTELESDVEELRGRVINRKSRVNMSEVETMALILSKSSKTVADLKLKFPSLQDAMKSLMAFEMERMVSEEEFLKEEPNRLESVLKRCKKLTGTLVTLKRLASVQEQRLPDIRLSPTADETPPITPTSGRSDGSGNVVGTSGCNDAGGRHECDHIRAENTLDSLLDELQRSATKSAHSNATATLRRLHSYPSSDNKPPVPERHIESSGKRIPPPPPPRTSSKSPLASPTNPNAPVRLAGSPTRKGSLGSLTKMLKDKLDPSASTSSSCESINSQEGIQQAQSRQEHLELRHQELLKKQKALQEQYTRLQQLQKTSPPDLLQLKKTGSESNILVKMGLGLSATSISGSLSHLAHQNDKNIEAETNSSNAADKTKIYETDIL